MMRQRSEISMLPSRVLFSATLMLFCVFAQLHLIAQDGLKQAEPSKSDLNASPLDSKRAENAAKKEDVVAPWEERKIDNDLPDLREVRPRDLLADLDEGEVENLADPGEIEPGSSTLLKILYRVSRFSQYDVRTFAKRTESVSPVAIGESPKKHRFNVFPISGRVVKVRRMNLPQRTAELFQLTDKRGDERDFEFYYQAEAVLQPGNVSATICTIEVPNQWLTAKVLDEPFEAAAMFLKFNNERNEPIELLFAAHRLEWFPETANVDATLEGGPLLLAQQGFDVSLLHDAELRNRKSINAVDADCFYRMLAVVDSLRTNPKQQEIFSSQQVPEFDLVELMNNPTPHHGDVYMIDADIRRVTRVEVDTALYRDFFQLDHYFQLDGFVDTDVIIKDPNLEKEGLVGYGKRYPVSICVPALPDGMGANERRVYKIRLPAFYFKTWTFKSQLSRDHDPRLRHVAPLMIGLQPELQSSVAKSSMVPFVVVTTLCIALFGFIWYGFWRQSRMGKESGRTRFQIGRPDLDVADQVVDTNKIEAPEVKTDFPQMRD